MRIGYARVSTKEQNLDMQIEALKAAGCEKIFSEKLSGRIGSRPELDACLSFIRQGDTLIVYKLDSDGKPPSTRTMSPSRKAASSSTKQGLPSGKYRKYCISEVQEPFTGYYGETALN